MTQQIYIHEFADSSGSVFFDTGSGETVVLALSKAELLNQVNDSNSELSQSGNKQCLALVYQFFQRVD